MGAFTFTLHIHSLWKCKIYIHCVQVQHCFPWCVRCTRACLASWGISLHHSLDSYYRPQQYWGHQEENSFFLILPRFLPLPYVGITPALHFSSLHRILAGVLGGTAHARGNNFLLFRKFIHVWRTASPRAIKASPASLAATFRVSVWEKRSAFSEIFPSSICRPPCQWA